MDLDLPLSVIYLGSGVMAALLVAILTLRQLPSESVRGAFRALRENGFQFLPIVFATMAALAVGVATLFPTAPTVIERDTSIYERLVEVSSANLRLQDQIDELRSFLQQPTEATSGSEPRAIRNLEARIAKAESSVTAVESLILTDAERLVTVPILVREVQSMSTEIGGLRDQLALQSETLRDGIADARSQARWILGTLALGLFALVIPILRSSVSTRKVHSS